MIRNGLNSATIAALGLALAAPVFAHTAGEPAAGFLAGLAHPVTGLDHIVAMVAVGLWGAQLGAPALWILPVVFPLVMALGGLLGLLGIPLPGVEIGIAASALMLGGAVMSGKRWPIAVAAIAVGFFAIFHGHAHGTELPAGQSALLYSVGFVIATGCLHAIGILIGSIHRWPSGAAALRVAGGGIAACGAFFLWRAMA